MHYAKERDECRAELFTWSQLSALPWILKECGINRETSLARFFPGLFWGGAAALGRHSRVSLRATVRAQGAGGEKGLVDGQNLPGLGVLWVLTLPSRDLCSKQGVAVPWHCWAPQAAALGGREAHLCPVEPRSL